MHAHGERAGGRIALVGDIKNGLEGLPLDHRVWVKDNVAGHQIWQGTWLHHRRRSFLLWLHLRQRKVGYLGSQFLGRNRLRNHRWSAYDFPSWQWRAQLQDVDVVHANARIIQRGDANSPNADRRGIGCIHPKLLVYIDLNIPAMGGHHYGMSLTHAYRPGFSKNGDRPGRLFLQ